MTFLEIETEIIKLIMQLRDMDPARSDQLAIAENYLQHHEYGVALEYVCDWLGYSRTVPLDVFEAIRALANEMQIDDGHWHYLKPLTGKG